MWRSSRLSETEPFCTLSAECRCSLSYPYPCPDSRVQLSEGWTWTGLYTQYIVQALFDIFPTAREQAASV